MDRDSAIVEKLRPSGRAGASVFAACCAERLRPLLNHVPSGASPLVAGVALTELWRVLEGLQRADIRRMEELSKACWTLVEIEPIEGVATELLDALVAAARAALETYLSGNPLQAVPAAKSCGAVCADDLALQDRDVIEITAAKVTPGTATRMRERAETEGAKRVSALLGR